MFLNRRQKADSERGMALIVALLSLMLISAIAIGMMGSAKTETAISANFRDEQVAFFSARGGLDEVRDRMRAGTPNSLSASLPSAAPNAANGIVYVTDGTATPWTAGSQYADNEICQEGVTCPVSNSTQTLGSASYAATPPLAWRWVRLNWKVDNSGYSVDGQTSANPVCYVGNHEHVQPSCDPANAPQVYELTALAVTPTGSRRMVQYEVAQTSIPPTPGAMVFDGSNPTYNAPNSNVFNVTGIDQHTGPPGFNCTTKKQDKAALGALDGNSVTSLTRDVQNRPSNYTGSSGTTPDVQNVNSQLGPLSSVDGLQALVNSITNMATVLPGNPPGINLGTSSAPTINVVQGDLTLGGGTTGAGILVVTGTLTMSGNPSYNGIILVIGKGSIVKNGGGNGTLNGSIFVANMFDSSGNPIPLGANPPNAPGAPSISWNGGGNASIQYDSCWVQAVTRGMPYRLLSSREEFY